MMYEQKCENLVINTSLLQLGKNAIFSQRGKMFCVAHEL